MGRAKSVKMLLLVSAMSLTPDQNSILQFIQQELSLMFSAPENHIVVGVTKTRLVAHVLTEDEEELLEIVKGENGESRSFKGYEVCLVE